MRRSEHLLQLPCEPHVHKPRQECEYQLQNISSFHNHNQMFTEPKTQSSTIAWRERERDSCYILTPWCLLQQYNMQGESEDGKVFRQGVLCITGIVHLKSCFIHAFYFIIFSLFYIKSDPEIRIRSFDLTVAEKGREVKVIQATSESPRQHSAAQLCCFCHSGFPELSGGLLF